MLLTNPTTYENSEMKARYYPENPQFKTAGMDIDETEAAAVSFVQKLGIRPNLNGYHLLISSIMLVIEYPELKKSLTKGLYPVLAVKYGKNVKSVERNMRKAIESAYEYDPDRICSLFYYKVGKPYISEVLSLAVEMIRYNKK
ncbi:MAG: hypothetical protein GX567_10015 [Clostridia bacterium]|nr:hypothetical protein [Clostridia bacterium]